MKAEPEQPYYEVNLRADQWDMIVLALQHIRAMSLGGDSQYGVDRMARKFLRRRIDECVTTITGQVPECGTEST